MQYRISNSAGVTKTLLCTKIIQLAKRNHHCHFVCVRWITLMSGQFTVCEQQKWHKRVNSTVGAWYVLHILLDFLREMGQWPTAETGDVRESVLMYFAALHLKPNLSPFLLLACNSLYRYSALQTLHCRAANTGVSTNEASGVRSWLAVASDQVSDWPRSTAWRTCDQTWHILWCRSRTDDRRTLLHQNCDSPGYCTTDRHATTEFYIQIKTIATDNATTQ